MINPATIRYQALQIARDKTQKELTKRRPDADLMMLHLVIALVHDRMYELIEQGAEIDD